MLNKNSLEIKLTYEEYKTLVTNRYSQYTNNIGFWETATTFEWAQK